MASQATSQLCLELPTRLLEICRCMQMEAGCNLNLQATVNDTEGRLFLEKKEMSVSMVIQANTESLLHTLQDGWKCAISSVAMETDTSELQQTFHAVEASMLSESTTDKSVMPEKGTGQDMVRQVEKAGTLSHGDTSVDDRTSLSTDQNSGERKLQNQSLSVISNVQGQTWQTNGKVSVCDKQKDRSRNVERLKPAKNTARTCMICSESQSTLKRLKLHLQSCHKLSCNVLECSKKDSDEVNATSNSRKSDGEDGINSTCKICGTLLTKPFAKSLSTHCCRVHGLTVTEYQTLDTIPQAGREKYLKEKQETLKQHQAKIETCPDCAKSFRSFVLFSRHVRTKHPGNQRLLLEVDKRSSASNTSKVQMTCPLCSETRNGKTIFQHIKKMHSNSENFDSILVQLETEFKEKSVEAKRKKYKAFSAKGSACIHCGKFLERRWTRLRHQDKCPQNPNPQKSLRCTRCSYDTKNPTLLESHMKKHEDGKRAYVCELCGASYLNSSSLYNHKRKVHNITAKDKVTWHVCAVCNKKMHDKTAFEQHLKRHAGVHDQMCDHCGKAFKTEHDLRKHINAVHLNKYQYRCDKCGHGMAKLSYLERHKCGRVRRVQRQDSAVVKPSKKLPKAPASGDVAQSDRNVQGHVESQGHINVGQGQGHQQMVSVEELKTAVIRDFDNETALPTSLYSAMDFNVPLISTPAPAMTHHPQPQPVVQESAPHTQLPPGQIFLQPVSHTPLPSLQSSYLCMTGPTGQAGYGGLVGYDTHALESQVDHGNAQ